MGKLKKSSFLEGAFIATACEYRLTITDVLASDEISSAVSGDIMSSDFVITTSEKPLENGMQIRMED